MFTTVSNSTPSFSSMTSTSTETAGSVAYQAPSAFSTSTETAGSVASSTCSFSIIA